MKKRACVLVWLLAGTAQAGLLGDEISVSGADITIAPEPGFDWQPGSATIGTGAEFTFIDDVFFDFGDSSLSITHNEDHAHGWGDFGFVTFSGFDNVITGLSLSSVTGMSGDILSDFSFTSDSLTFHLGSSQSAPFGQMVFAITSSPAVPEIPTVPEPATLALVALGLGGIGLYSRKRNTD